MFSVIRVNVLLTLKNSRCRILKRVFNPEAEVDEYADTTLYDLFEHQMNTYKPLFAKVMFGRRGCEVKLREEKRRH